MKTIDAFFKRVHTAGVRRSPRKTPQGPQPAAPAVHAQPAHQAPPPEDEPAAKRHNAGSPSPSKASLSLRRGSLTSPRRRSPAIVSPKGKQSTAEPQEQEQAQQQQQDTPLEQGEQQQQQQQQEVSQQNAQQQDQQQQPQQQQPQASSSAQGPADDAPTSHLDSQRLAQARAIVASAQRERKPLLLESLLLDDSWRAALAGELRKPYFSRLQQMLQQEWAGSHPIYPPPEMVFRAFNACPLNKVRVVIIGQDPYHGPNQGMGLCFSVNRGIKVPPSLVNIFKELNDDLKCAIPPHGDLTKWSHQGVMLLNTVLTVRQGQANSHKSKGWEAFTDAAISQLAQKRKGIVFLLWGKPAQAKEKLIPATKHHVLKCPHPSPLASASGGGFLGCRHFSKANALLVKSGLPPIDWAIE